MEEIRHGKKYVVIRNVISFYNKKSVISRLKRNILVFRMMLL
jgi:hypothetical protein